MEDLTNYLSIGIKNIIKRVTKFSVGNIKELAFAIEFNHSSERAKHKREEYLVRNQHIPPFLIASITKNCNLFCKGCYSRALHGCHTDSEISCERWDEIFSEAKDLGISFILLAGGEPLMRGDVIKVAAKHKSIAFPIFTNGTMIDEQYIKLFNQNRNLIPIFSIEGEGSQTDQRRGADIFNGIMNAMERLGEKQIIFGVSVTVTTENVAVVTSDEFIKALYKKGCAVMFFIEYVPVTIKSQKLAPTDETRIMLDKTIEKLRLDYQDMIFISFPGDEKHMGGCLAAGRGFFHISSAGDAEPCPFSPYSDINLKDHSILQALDSGLFNELKLNGILTKEHSGGCTLFAQKDEVEGLLKIDNR